jgi:ATP-dependent RNA helicase RhlE
VLVFTRTKHGANKLVEQLEKDGIGAMAIHGNKSQSARTKALSEFKDGKLQVLVATDIAARGIDIDQLPHVVNYDLPNVPEDYVHRIGRTGRAGATGEAVSLVCVDEHEMLKDIEKLIKQTLPREVIPGFEPDPNARAAADPAAQRRPGHRNGRAAKAARRAVAAMAAATSHARPVATAPRHAAAAAAATGATQRQRRRRAAPAATATPHAPPPSTVRAAAAANPTDKGVGPVRVRPGYIVRGQRAPHGRHIGLG